MVDLDGLGFYLVLEVGEPEFLARVRIRPRPRHDIVVAAALNDHSNRARNRVPIQHVVTLVAAVAVNVDPTVAERTTQEAQARQ